MVKQMSKNDSVAKTLADIKKLLGAPPVLTSESLRTYDRLLTQVVEAMQPRDIIEMMFVKDVVNASWEISRYETHQTLVIERQHQRRQEQENKRRQHERKRKKELVAYKEEQREQAERTAESANQDEQQDQTKAPTTLFERMLELEEVIDATVSDVDEIIEAVPDEVDHAIALEAGIDYFVELDRLRSVAIARRNEALRQLDFYHHGLGERLRRITDQIIDAEISQPELPAPSIAGPTEDGQ